MRKLINMLVKLNWCYIDDQTMTHEMDTKIKLKFVTENDELYLHMYYEDDIIDKIPCEDLNAQQVIEEIYFKNLPEIALKNLRVGIV